MIVYQDESYKFWIYSNETKKIININANGARKVASVCNQEIEVVQRKFIDKLRASGF